MEDGVWRLENSFLSDLIIPNLSPVDEAIRSANDMSNYLAYIFENPDEIELVNQMLSDESVVRNRDVKREKLSPSDWALKYRLIKGKPMSFHNFPYQKEILDDLYPKQVMKKSAQMGISEIMLTKLFWFGDYELGKAIYTFPTHKDMIQYGASRLPQIIEGCIDVTPDDPYWNPKYVNSPTTYIESMLYINNASMRRINDFFIYYKGTFGDNSAISIDSDWNLHDEVNFSNQNVLNKFKSRLGASDMAWEYQFSTPTIPGFGVSKTFIKSDMRVWEVRCPHCSKSYKMDFERNVTELANGKGFIYICHNCKFEIKPDTIRNGHFVAQSPGAEWHGYHISKMMNPRFTANQLIESKEGYKRTSDFYNFDLGEDYSESSTALTYEQLDNLSKPYKLWGSAKEEHCVVMGVDQGDVLWATLSIPDVNGKEKVIYMERIDTKDYEDEDPFQRVEELMNRFNVQMCVIDAMPNKNSARWLKNKFKNRVYMAFYTNTKDGDFDYNDDGVVNIDRTETFKSLFNDVATEKIITPEGFAITELFNKHHISLKKESDMNDDTGMVREYFIRTDADHFAHSNLYRKVARGIYLDKYGEKGSSSKASNSNPHWLNRGGFNRRSGVPPQMSSKGGLGGQGVIPRTIPKGIR